MLVGGTKSRAAYDYLSQCDDDTIIYASPACGMAQVAIADAARKLNKTFLLLTHKDEGEITPQTSMALDLGATVQFCMDLREADYRSKYYGGFLIPLGIDCPIYRQTLEESLRPTVSTLTLCGENSLYAPLGSGTLVTALRRVLPIHTHIYAVNVNVLEQNDYRIRAVSKLHNTTVIHSGYEFHEPCDIELPFQSNRFYDAKVIEFAIHHGRHGDYIWNVAG